MLVAPAASVVDRYLERVERAAPGLIDGFYVVGSVALGGFRLGRSDIDFVATLSEDTSADALRALRASHLRCYADGIARAAASRRWPLVCNGVFVRADDLARPPGLVTATAHQVAGTFVAGNGFDVNPVTWWTLAHHGITVRGPASERLAIHVDDHELRRWSAANLVSFWAPWAQMIASGGIRAWAAQVRQLGVRRLTASGVLGASRIYSTLRTGRVLSKEQAGEYCRRVFDRGWHSIIDEALAYWRDQDLCSRRPRAGTRVETAAFVSYVLDLVAIEDVTR